MLVGIPVYKCARDSPVAMVRVVDCRMTVGSRALCIFFSFSREREIGEMFVNDGNERIIDYGPGYDIMEENNI